MVKNVLKSVAARGVTFPITALAVLCTTYLTIDYAGNMGFAAISLISSLFLLFAYADLGLGASVINIVAETGDLAYRNAQIITVFRLLLAPAGLLGLVGVTGNTFFSWTDILGVDGQSATLVDDATMWVFIIFAAAVPLGVGQRILTGLQLNHLSVLLSSSSSIATLGLTYLFIALRLPYLWLSLGQASGVLLAAAVCSGVAFRKTGIRARDFLFSKSTPRRPLFSVAGPMVIIMIGMPVAFQSHRLVLAHGSDVYALAEYSLALQLYNPLWSFVSVAAMSLWPAFAANRASGEPAPKLKPLYLLLGGSALLMGLGLILLGRPVASLLSHSSISLGMGTLIAFSGLLFIQAVQQVPGMFFTSPSGLRFQSVCVTFMCIASLVISIVATPSVGALGPVVATAIAVASCQVVPGIIRLRKLDRTPRGVPASASSSPAR